MQKNLLADLWNSPHFDEGNFEYIDEILIQHPQDVDYFVSLWTCELKRKSELALVIITVIPYKPAIEYALNYDDWQISDFESLRWWDEAKGFYTLDDDQYRDWLSRPC